MAWNDELESLTLEVYETFGDAAMEDALSRAISTVKRRLQDEPPAMLLPPPSLDVALISDGASVVSLDALYDVLLVELRR